MKFLKNKGLVIILAVLAVGLVINNLVWPMIKRSTGTRVAAKGAPVPSAAPTANQPSQAAMTPIGSSAIAPSASTGKIIVPLAPMDVSSASASASGWASNPRRDPFHVRGGVKDGRSAQEQLTLTGTLRQTASTLAVLNNQVLTAGDSILGFKIESVEENRVWVSGPNGREAVEFRYSVTQPGARTLKAEPKSNLSLADPVR